MYISTTCDYPIESVFVSVFYAKRTLTYVSLFRLHHFFQQQQHNYYSKISLRTFEYAVRDMIDESGMLIWPSYVPYADMTPRGMPIYTYAVRVNTLRLFGFTYA